MRIGFKISGLVLGTALSATVALTWIGYSAARRQYFAGVDRQLTAVAAALPGVIGEEYLGGALDNDHPSAAAYDRLVHTLSDLADRSKVFYVYVFTAADDEVVHLATSASDEERATGDWPTFLQPYEQPPVELIATLADGKTRSAQYTDEFGSFRSIFVRHLGSNGRSCVIGVDVTLSQVRADLRMLIWRCLGAGGLVMVLTGALGLLLGRRISRPISMLAENLRGAAEARGGPTHVMDERRDDELGMLACSFNAFMSQLQAIRDTVTSSTSSVGAASSQIAASARQQEQTVQAFRESTSQAATAVAQIVAAGHNLRQIIGDVDTLAQDTNQKATSSRSDLNELDGLLGGMGEVTLATGARMEAIKASVDEIDMATTTIITVADMTNILSVNATIEAEKAGDHGRGFRVISREIRRLAERAAEATLAIESIVTGIHDSVAQGVADTTRFRDQMRVGIDSVRRLAGNMASIMNDVESLVTRFGEVNRMMADQAIGSEQMHQSIERLNIGAREIAETSAAFSAITNQLHETANELESHVSAFSGSVRFEKG